ncbi:hypothetical protein AB3S75_034925 [Citrus x aurantiifolia]
MPLLVNGHRNSIVSDRKLNNESLSHAESNGGGGDLPRAAMALDRAPKVVNSSTAQQRQIDSLGGCGWSEMAKGKVSNKTQVVASPKTSEIVANRGNDFATFHDFDRWLSIPFSMARMA